MLTAPPAFDRRFATRPCTEVANDTHSALNPTRIARRFTPRNVEEVQRVVERAARRGEPLAIAGGRHAMGGQQFLSDGWLLDMRGLDRCRSFDVGSGHIVVEAGCQWPQLMRHYVVAQHEQERRWGIRQKQTGADRLTIGGAVSANIHGRVLTGGPFADDVEALEVVTADGALQRCSRRQNGELFRHVVGGYGLFGVVTAVELRLQQRVKLERIVELARVEELLTRLEERIAAGAIYGDFQFSTDPQSEHFLRTGVLSCYHPVDPRRPVPRDQRRLSQPQWNRLLELAHLDKRRAFETFTEFYLATSGQLYWSDTHQLNLYLEAYHDPLDRRLGARVRGSEMITEIYVPRERLTAFLADARTEFRARTTNLIYGTIRLIDADTTSALPWARRNWACVIFNLHVDHTPEDLEANASTFRWLIDRGIDEAGSYYLTYHRYATARQIESCHPAIRSWLAAKQRWDPDGCFQSDWHAYLRDTLEGSR